MRSCVVSFALRRTAASIVPLALRLVSGAMRTGARRSFPRRERSASIRPGSGLHHDRVAEPASRSAASMSSGNTLKPLDSTMMFFAADERSMPFLSTGRCRRCGTGPGHPKRRGWPPGRASSRGNPRAGDEDLPVRSELDPVHTRQSPDLAPGCRYGVVLATCHTPSSHSPGSPAARCFPTPAAGRVAGSRSGTDGFHRSAEHLELALEHSPTDPIRVSPGALPSLFE